MGGEQKRTLSDMLASRLIPDRFLAGQLRRPSGRFGRWVMARGLNSGNAELIEAVIDALALGPGDRFLDMGFGGGLALRRASERTRGPLVGVDFSPDMVVQAGRSLSDLLAAGRLNLLSADVVDLPLRDNLFDAICTTNTIYFWPDPDRALAELSRVLEPGGRIAFGYSGRDKMQRFDNITRHGFRTFTPDDLHGLLERAGFSRVRSIALRGGVVEGDHVTVASRA